MAKLNKDQTCRKPAHPPSSSNIHYREAKVDEHHKKTSSSKKASLEKTDKRKSQPKVCSSSKKDVLVNKKEGKHDTPSLQKV